VSRGYGAKFKKALKRILYGILIAAGAFLALLILFGILADDPTPSDTVPADNVPAASPQAANTVTAPDTEFEEPATTTQQDPEDGNRTRITVYEETFEEEYGEEWPLTVPEATLVLLPFSVIIARTEQGVFAMNGTAQNHGYAPIDPIWRDNPDIPGTKINIGPLRDALMDLQD